MNLASILPRSGACLLFGRVSEYQSPLAWDMALTVAKATSGPIVIVSSSDEFSKIPGRVRAWRAARKIPDDTRIRVHSVAAKLVVGHSNPARQIEQEAAVLAPVLVLYDLATRTQPINQHEPWLQAAKDIAYDLRTTVLTVAHTSHNNAVPDIDCTLIRCASYHDKERQSSLNVELSFVGTERPPMRLLGSQVGSTIMFNPEMESVDA